MSSPRLGMMSQGCVLLLKDLLGGNLERGKHKQATHLLSTTHSTLEPEDLWLQKEHSLNLQQKWFMTGLVWILLFFFSLSISLQKYQISLKICMQSMQVVGQQWQTNKPLVVTMIYHVLVGTINKIPCSVIAATKFIRVRCAAIHFGRDLKHLAAGFC